MNKYLVMHEDEQWEIEASDLSDAQEIVLDGEGYKISLKKEIDYSIYYQRNKRYAGMKVGNSNLSIHNFGCFLFSLAFMVKKDPIEVNEILKKTGSFSGALIKSKEAAKALGLDLLKGDDKYITGKMNNINYMPKFTSIKEVYLGKSQHFVVRIIDAEGKRIIFDTWTGKILPINHYLFKSYRLFKVK